MGALDDALASGKIDQSTYDLIASESANTPPVTPAVESDGAGGRVVASQRGSSVPQSYRRAPGESMADWQARTGSAPDAETVDVPIAADGVRPRGAPTTESIPVTRTRSGSDVAPQSPAAAIPPASGSAAGPAAKDGTRFVDPSGGDTQMGQDRAAMEKLAEQAIVNPDAVVAGGGGGRSAVVPVGGSQTVQQQLPVQGELDARAQFEDAQRRQAELDAHQVEREVAGAQKVAAVEAEKAKIAQKAAEDAALEQQQTAKEVQARIDKFDLAVDDYAKTSNKIDGNRLWNQASTGQKIGGAIAILLSGLGAGMQGGRENLALRQMDDAINRDLQAQSMALSARARGVDLATNGIDIAMKAGASREEAKLLVYGKSLEAAQQQIVAQMAATKVPDKLEALQGLSNQLDQKIAANRVELAQSMRQTVQSSVQQRRVTVGGTAGKPVTAAEQANRARELLGTPKFDGTKYSKTLGVQFADEKTRQANDEKSRQMMALKSLSGELRGLRAKYGVNWVDRVGRAKAEAYAAQMAVQLTVAQGQGAMSKNDGEISQAAIAGEHNPLDMLSTMGARTEVLDRVADVTIQSLRDEGVAPDRVPPNYKLKERAREKLLAARGEWR